MKIHSPARVALLLFLLPVIALAQVVVLEDWEDVTQVSPHGVRRNGYVDGEFNSWLWKPYVAKLHESNPNGPHPNSVSVGQEGTISFVRIHVRPDLVATSGPDASLKQVDFEFLPLQGHSVRYPWPNGFLQSNARPGETQFSRNTNRMEWWMRSGVDQPEAVNWRWDVGTYVKPHDHNAWNQGAHYYHRFADAMKAGVWTKFRMDRVPHHLVGNSGTNEYPEDPEWVAPHSPQGPVHYFDGLTRFYIQNVYIDSVPKPTANWELNIAPFLLYEKSGEPDEYVHSVMASYYDGRYHISFSGFKSKVVHYEIRFATKSLRLHGWNSGTVGGTVTQPGSSYAHVSWESQPMPKTSGVMYFGVRPIVSDGQSINVGFTEFTLEPSPQEWMAAHRMNQVAAPQVSRAPKSERAQGGEEE